MKPEYDYTWIETIHLIGYETATPPPRLRLQRSDLQRLVQLTALHFGVDREELLARTRSREVTQRRHMMRAYINSRWTLTLKEIGAATGGFDHSTVIHSFQVHGDLMCVDKEYRNTYNAYTEKMAAAGL